jgi:glutamyl-tRNA synthetase
MPFADFNKIAQVSYNEFAGINPDLRTEKISELLQSRISQLNEIKELVAFFYNLPEYTAEIYEHKKMKTDLLNSLENLKFILPVIESLTDWSQERIHDVLIQFAIDHALKNGQVMWPIRTALSGLPTSPGGAVELLYILGKAESVKRIKQGILLLEM